MFFDMLRTLTRAKDTPIELHVDGQILDECGVRSQIYSNTVCDLVERAIHCCYGDGWPSRLGGLDALLLLISRISVQHLRHYIASLTKALLHSMRLLPDHSSEQQSHIIQILSSALRQSLGEDDVLPTVPPQKRCKNSMPSLHSTTIPAGTLPEMGEGACHPITPPNETWFTNLLDAFVGELSSGQATEGVREAVMSCFQVLEYWLSHDHG